MPWLFLLVLNQYLARVSKQYQQGYQNNTLYLLLKIFIIFFKKEKAYGVYPKALYRYCPSNGGYNKSIVNSDIAYKKI